MKQAKQMKTRNYIAKNAPTTGAGVHKDKSGKFASRARNKQNYLRNQEK